MTTVTEDLQELHRLHLALREVQDQLRRGPKQIAARQKLVDKAEASLAESEATLKQQRVVAEQKGHDLKVNETHLSDMQAKLNAAASNREFDIIKGQIEADMMAKSVLEDEILEVLDRIDTMKSDIEQSKQAVTDAEQAKAKFETDFRSREGDLNSQAAEYQAQITQAESVLSGESAIRYRRLVDAEGADAMAAVENAVCKGCNVGITPQKRVELNSGAIVFCSTCGRLQYKQD